MRVLVDSHAVIWFVDDIQKLSALALSTIQEPSNEVLISTATIWEIAIKVGLNKLNLTMPFRDWIHRAFRVMQANKLGISVDSADIQSKLPWHHRDPFDRMLASQAIVENLSIVSADSVFDMYGLTRIW